MPRLVPETAFALVCPEGDTAERIREYHDHLRETERALDLSGGETPLADRLDTAATVEQSVPGEIVDLTSRIDDALLEHLEADAVVAILEPSGVGFTRVFDPDRLSALLDVVEHRREDYLEARTDHRGDVEGRVVKPELEFEANYVAPVEFAIDDESCAIQWEFFRSDDLRPIRWPELP